MKLEKGMSVTCKIHETEITDAKIQDEKGNFYICQNLMNGDECEDKLGYKYSWSVLDGSPFEVADHGVKNLQPAPDNNIKSRIDALNENTSIKALDDLIEEIRGDIIGYLFWDKIIRVGCGEGHKEFPYTDQRSKLTALKNALMWVAEKTGKIEPDIIGEVKEMKIDGRSYKVKVLEKTNE